MSTRTKDIDDAAFGVIYGAITVMGVLAVTNVEYFDPLTTGLTLFVTVLAVALAKAYAEVAADTLKSGMPASWSSIWSVWGHSRTTLIAANGPTLAMLGGALQVYSPATTLVLAQVLAIALLLFYGWRIGWRLSGRVAVSVLSALSMGSAGLVLTALKNAFY